PKIHRLLDEYLVDFPALQTHPFPCPEKLENDWQEMERQRERQRERERERKSGVLWDRMPDLPWARPGEEAARRHLEEFVNQRLVRYHIDRNNPALNGQSDLSIYLHFGQISAQRVALAA